MRNRRSAIIFGIFAVLVVGFIWSNSCMSREASGQQSGFVMQFLKPLLDPKGVITEEDFHHGVRKAAHFLEFATLGLLIGGLFAGVQTKAGGYYKSLPVLLVLMVAVLDEYIQLFADRGSQVADVILDFSGGLTGLGIAALLALWIKRIRK